MSKLLGGIFSRPLGKTGGIVFGAARTRLGKVATSRELVPPSNPNTVAQQNQRNVFKDSLEIVRQIGASIFQDDWNRAISQLPGFQSMMSIFMSNMDDAGLLTAPPDTPLGSLHFPDTYNVATGSGAGEVDVTWTDELGPNGTNFDSFLFICIPTARADRTGSFAVVAPDDTRADLAFTITGLQAGVEYLIAGYMRGDGTADGLLTLARWEVVTAHA